MLGSACAEAIDHPVHPWGRMSDLLTQIATERSDEAFRRLFMQYGPRIAGYMMRQGADAATAEELAQETLLAVWSKAGLYSSDKGSPTTWIFTIARNLRIDALRKNVCWQQLSDELADTVASEEAPPDHVAWQRQREARVQAVLADLPAEQRAVITLAFIDGLSQSDIAARLSLPLGTVKSRMRLAYEKVRAALEDLR
jgi:RNA polymerase sigma-70 factor, ECF subfamily